MRWDLSRVVKKYGGREVVGVERWFSRGEGPRKLSNRKVHFTVGQILVKSRQSQGRGVLA